MRKPAEADQKSLLGLQSFGIFECFFSLLLSTLNLWKWKILGLSAFEGPGLDMVGFFERYRNPLFAPTDYFVNSSMEPNPRHFFGYLIIGVSKFFNGSWYSAFFFLKFTIVLLLPITFFILILRISSELKESKLSILETFFAFVLVAFGSLDPILTSILSVRKWWSVAWWQPYFDYVAPHSLALFFGLWGLIFFRPQGSRNIASLAFFLTSFLINPPMGFCILCLLSIFSMSVVPARSAIKTLLPSIVLFVTGGLSLGFYFRVPNPVDTALAREIYINLAHPSHYLPREFGSFSGYSWIVSFMLNIIWMVIPFFIRIPDKVRRWCLLSAVFFLGQLVLQYLAAETNFSKSLVLLGPARFFLFGYWLGAIAIVCIEKPKWNFRISPRFNHKFFAALNILMACILLITVYFNRNIDDPKQRLFLENQDLYGWIERNTSISDTFLVPFGDLPTALPFVVGRAVVAGTGFPFSESHFLDYKRRESFAYGNPEERERFGGGWVGEKMSRAFRSRTPEDVLEVSQSIPIQFVIREKKYPGEFNSIQADFQNETFLIYGLESIKKFVSAKKGK